jgi:hypothetical protein
MMCFEYYFRYITEEERIQILNILVFGEKDVDEETEKTLERGGEINITPN